MKKTNLLAILMIISTLLSSCSSDDSQENSICDEIIEQPAKGVFRGFNFTVNGGDFRSQFDEYFCRIHVFEVTGGSCTFPEFEPIQGSIIFSLSNLSPQTINLSDVLGEGESLNFNTIETIDNESVTVVELATCGKIEITEASENMITGRVVATGQKGSTINGNFTLDLCQN